MVLEGGWLIFTIIVTFILGIVAGTFLSRFTLKKYFEKNPPITEEMIISMLGAMGQQPNKKRVNQIMRQVKGGK